MCSYKFEEVVKEKNYKLEKQTKTIYNKYFEDMLLNSINSFLIIINNILLLKIIVQKL